MQNLILPALRPALPAADFDRLALALLRHQAGVNPVYKRFLAAKNLHPPDLPHWSAFPALPVQAFRNHTVTCFPASEATLCFETSGTTSTRTGRHYLASPACYETALYAAFRQFLPDLSQHRWIMLVPPFAERPQSSLAYMLDYLARQIPATPAHWLCPADYELDPEALAHCLNLDTVRPVALFGTSFALAQCAEFFQTTARHWSLPADSLVFDTGGYKGRHRELSRPEFCSLLQEIWAIPPGLIYNEYGMTELSSQGYADLSEGIHRFPDWVRVRVVNPDSTEACRSGESGLVQIYDLANVGSVMAVETLDAAVQEKNGIRLLGRISNSEPRGCSLPYEIS